MTTNAYSSEGLEFLAYLRKNCDTLQPVSAKSIFSRPDQCAVLAVDVTNGFCRSGALASERVNTIVSPIVHLMKTAWAAGVRQFVLSQDTHEPDAVEFSSWPAHCVRGTAEAETVDEIKQLPFFNSMTVFQKNSLSSLAATDYLVRRQDRPDISTIVVVGDCTDLCIYQLGMDLRTDADALQLQRRVIVPANCVQTYDYQRHPPCKWRPAASG